MKKSMIITGLVVIALVATLLVGCGGESQGTTPAPASQPATQAPAVPQETTTQEVTEAATQAAETQPAATQPAATQPAATTITQEKALEIALQHAGVSQSDAVRIDVDYEFDDDFGRQTFDVEFHVGNMEYSYDIDPDNGNILKSDKDYDDD